MSVVTPTCPLPVCGRFNDGDLGDFLRGTSTRASSPTASFGPLAEGTIVSAACRDDNRVVITARQTFHTEPVIIFVSETLGAACDVRDIRAYNSHVVVSSSAAGNVTLTSIVESNGEVLVDKNSRGSHDTAVNGTWTAEQQVMVAIGSDAVGFGMFIDSSRNQSEPHTGLGSTDCVGDEFLLLADPDSGALRIFQSSPLFEESVCGTSVPCPSSDCRMPFATGSLCSTHTTDVSDGVLGRESLSVANTRCSCTSAAASQRVARGWCCPPRKLSVPGAAGKDLPKVYLAKHASVFQTV